jgi:hypothetical protein
MSREDGNWTDSGRWQWRDRLLRPLGRTGVEDGRRRFPHDEHWDNEERRAKRRDELRQLLYRNGERLFWTILTVVLIKLGFGPPPA